MKEKVKSDIVLLIENAIKNILEINNFLLVDIDYKGGNKKVITIYVYNSKKPDIDELGNISKLLFPIINNISYFKDNFLLEVSSPGLFREIKYKKELDIFKNRNLKILTNLDEVYTGISLGIINDVFILKNGNSEFKFKIEEIKKAELNG